jgi:predicted aconitase
MKYPDFLDICVALTGRAPKGGPHVQINRMASLIVNVEGIENANIDDSFYPLLGYRVGALAPSQIPVIVGIKSLAPSKDDMKAFGAAFATVSSAPMFHILGVTPEAVELGAVVAKGPDVRSISVHLSDLIGCWDELNSASKDQPVDLVSLGNPHFSFDEIQTLNGLCRGRKKDKDVAIVVTCARFTYSAVCNAGLLDELEEFGVQFVTDTCWCMITDPTIPRSKGAIMTNSGKYAHYGPGLTGKSFYFGSLARCVDAACGYSYLESRPQWLRKSSQ